MKKFFTLIGLAFMAISMNAQSYHGVSDTEVWLAEDILGTAAEAGWYAGTATGTNTKFGNYNPETGAKLDEPASFTGIAIKGSAKAAGFYVTNITGFTCYGVTTSGSETRNLLVTYQEVGGTAQTAYASSAPKETAIVSVTGLDASKKYAIVVTGTKDTDLTSNADMSLQSVWFTGNGTYVEVAAEPYEATTWDFTSLSDTDLSNITSDGLEWSADEGVYTYKPASGITGAALTANGNELSFAKGLLFTIVSGKTIKLDTSKGYMNLPAKNTVITINDLAKDDVVRIRFKSNGAEERGFTVSGAADVEAIYEASRAWIDYELTVKADGALTLVNTASVNVAYITANQALPEPEAASVKIAEGGLSTYVSTENLDFTDPIDGLTAYFVIGYNQTKTALLVAEVDGAVPAGTAVLLEGTAGESYNIPLATASDVEFANTESNLLIGSAYSTTTLADNQGFILSAADGLFYACAAGTLAKGKAYVNLDPTEMTASLSEAKLGIVLVDSDEATGISNIQSETVNNGAIYNLSGARVSNASQKGVYIMNGKKYIVK